MPIPDALPIEIWYRIIKLGEFSNRDSKPMLAVAPQTTARNMHDAAFSTIFQSLYIGFGWGIDCKRLALKLSSYLDSLQLRSAVRYLRVDISTEPWAEEDGPEPWIGGGEWREFLPPDLDDLICNVLSALPNIIELDWRDYDHIGSRKERRWNCIRSCLPQLTKLTFRQHEFESTLDLRTANALQFLSLQRSQFYPPDDGPWIISDAKIQTLSLHIEDLYRERSPMRIRRAPDKYHPTNIFSRLNLSSVNTLYLGVLSPSQQDISCLLTRSLSNDGFGLGANLQFLLLCKVELPLARALGNACSFPSLHSCYIECLSFSPSSGIHYLVRPLCLFLKRQISIEKLECKFSQLDMDRHDAAQCVNDVVNMLYDLKDLKYLKLSSYAFSLYHPILLMTPLPQLQVLSIRSTTTVPLTEIAGTVIEKLQSFPSLRSFHLNVLMGRTLMSDHEWLNFVKTLKDTSQIEFIQGRSVSSWLGNEDGPEPHKILSGNPKQSFDDLLKMYRYRTNWGDYFFDW